MEQGCHGEVAPLVWAVFLHLKVSVVFFVEPVFLVAVTVYPAAVIYNLFRLGQLLGAVQGFCPQVLVGIEFLKLLHVHGFLDFIFNHHHHVADGVDGVAPVFSGIDIGEQIFGIPRYKIHFSQFQELLYASAVAVRVILALRLTQWDFFDSNSESGFHGQQPITHYVVGTGADFLAFVRLGRVGIRQEAHLRGVLLQLLQLPGCPVSAQ